MELTVVSIAIGVLALFLGITLGAILGRVGSFEILNLIVRLPVILIKSPGKMKSKLKMWKELANARKVERFKARKKINELGEGITGHKKEIKKIRAQIRQVKWGD